MGNPKKCYVCEESEQGTETHDTAYRIYKLLYYTLILLGAVLFIVLIDVAVFNDYSMRQTMLYMAITGVILTVSERIMEFKLKRWGVIA